MKKSLAGKKIAVLVENKFIPDEIEAYRSCFAQEGARVDFLSRIWFGDYNPAKAGDNFRAPTFYSDVDPLDSQPWQTPVPLVLDRQGDISAVKLTDYAAIIMSANFTSVRLRWDFFEGGNADFKTLPPGFDVEAFIRKPPAARFFAEAMQHKQIVKGALCHGLWILSPFPELLRGRQVICNTVVMADIRNCGAKIILNATGVVVDDDLVTGFSKHEVMPFIDAIIDQIVARA